jgi:hypothetical protein
MSFDWVNALDNPLGRLLTLPDMMGWRGAWTETDTYYKNEVVVDTTTTGSFIYTGFNATIRGGLPPSQVIGPSIWTAIGVISAGGVVALRKGDGIDIEGSDTVPTVVNNGVRTIGLSGLDNIGTEQFQVLDAFGVISVQQGIGINISGTSIPKITNAGLINVVGGSGISSTVLNNVITLSNSGVISVEAAPDTALTVTPGQNPIIDNTGILAIIEGTGIGLVPGRPTNEPQITNTGVITLRGSSVIVTPGTIPGEVALKMINPIRTLAFPATNFAMVPRTLTTTGQSAVVSVTQQTGTLWESIFLNGTPYNTGIFFLNSSFKLTGTPSSTIKLIQYYLQDTTQSPIVELGPYVVKNSPIGIADQDPIKTWFVTETDINIQTARNAGFRKLTGFRFQLGSIGSTPITVTLETGGSGWAIYFSQTTLRPFPN